MSDLITFTHVPELERITYNVRPNGGTQRVIGGFTEVWLEHVHIHAAMDFWTSLGCTESEAREILIRMMELIQQVWDARKVRESLKKSLTLPVHEVEVQGTPINKCTKTQNVIE
jgi:hypothetical protein